MTAAATLRRETFKTSRLAEFCSRRELVNQTGHDVSEWPIVCLKELVDNALDAAEEAGVAPVIDIVVDERGITVSDNGPGIAPDVIAKMLDYASRVSSREVYVSPTRGAQGNALKTIIAMAFSLDGERGETIIESRGVEHEIAFTVDQIRQEPRIDHATGPSIVKTGTKLTVLWPDCARSTLDDAYPRFLQVAGDYAFANPHMTLSVSWQRGGDPVTIAYKPTDTAWRKWLPSDPSLAHWYDVERLGRLIGAKIAHAEDNGVAYQTVRELITEFRGLSGTAKASAICGEIGATRQSLCDFYGGDGANVGRLLDAMKDKSRAPKPKDLGVIGSEHLLSRFREEGAVAESFVYKLQGFEVAGVPYVAECAFGMRVAEKADRRIIAGLNFSASVGANPFRNLGGRWAGLDSVLAEQRCGPREPIVFFLHLTSPCLQFTDRGKSAIALPPELSAEIVKAVAGVTAKWCKQRKAEERAASARSRRLDVMIRASTVTVKDAAAEVLPAAYAKASAGGTLPANARQIYYAARPDILELTGKDTLDSKYFTQTLLVDYIAERDLDWDVVFDDRGHFSEPHTKKSIGLGTLAVRNYLRKTHNTLHEEAAFGSASISTSGPHLRYGAVLFIEKEGFLPLIEKVQLAERYDIAIMSSKGMSVTAARLLADTTCAKHDIPLLTLHDFDRAGFSIGETSRREQQAIHVQERHPCRQSWPASRRRRTDGA